MLSSSSAEKLPMPEGSSWLPWMMKTWNALQSGSVPVLPREKRTCAAPRAGAPDAKQPQRRMLVPGGRCSCSRLPSSRRPCRPFRHSQCPRSWAPPESACSTGPGAGHIRSRRRHAAAAVTAQAVRAARQPRVAALREAVAFVRGRAPIAEDVSLEELHGLDHALPGRLVVVVQVAAQEQDVRLRPPPQRQTAAALSEHAARERRCMWLVAPTAAPPGLAAPRGRGRACARVRARARASRALCPARARAGLAWAAVAFSSTSSTARKLSSRRGGYSCFSAKPRWLSVEMKMRNVCASGGPGACHFAAACIPAPPAPRRRRELYCRRAPNLRMRFPYLNLRATLPPDPGRLSDSSGSRARAVVVGAGRGRAHACRGSTWCLPARHAAC